MNRRILIPTDFTVESLLLLKQAASSAEGKLEIVLMYCHKLSDSITDLLFYSPSKILKPLLSNDFSDACYILQNKYASRIASLKIEIFHGSNRRAFEKFINGMGVEEAFIPKSYKFYIHENSFDPVPLIQKSNLIIHEVDWEVRAKRSEKGSVAELFLN